MYMDDIKIFAKNEKEVESFIQIIRIYIKNIRIDFGIKKCAMLIREKRNKENIRILMEKENN